MKKVIAAFMVLALTPAAFAAGNMFETRAGGFYKELDARLDNDKNNPLTKSDIIKMSPRSGWTQKDWQREVAKLKKANSAGPEIGCEIFENGQWVFHFEADCIKDPAAVKEVYYIKRMIIDVAADVPTAYQTRFSTFNGGIVNIGSEMKEQLYLVKHSGLGKSMFMGYCAEDDTAYNPKKPWYFTSKRPDGTIKVNLTERALESVKFYYDYILEVRDAKGKKMYSADSEVARFWRRVVGGVFAHESLHGWQLKTGPVLDYKRVEPAQLNEYLAGRNIPEEVVSGIVKIIEYEDDAVRLLNEFIAPFASSDNIERQIKAWTDNKDILAAYPLLGNGPDPEHPRSFYAYYIEDTINGAKDALAGKDKENNFGPIKRYAYLGQSVPMKSLEEMIKINNSIAAGDSCDKYREEVAKKYNYTMDLVLPDFPRKVSPGLNEAIKGTIYGVATERGLPEVRQAVIKEFATFDKLCK